MVSRPDDNSGNDGLNVMAVNVMAVNVMAVNVMAVNVMPCSRCPLYVRTNLVT